jgi:choline dehydrogenase-like flavoprotein
MHRRLVAPDGLKPYLDCGDPISTIEGSSTEIGLSGWKGPAVQSSINSEFDTIVVGTGPGGATVARELSRHGHRVLMLERGRNDPIRGTALQTIRDLTWPGRGLSLTPELASVSRGITTGGSSVFYCATAFDPPLEMFRRHGIELADEVAEIKSELPYGPLSEELIGPFAAAIMASARDLGYEWKPLQKLVFQDHCRPGCDKCMMGCPHGAKWTSRFFVDEALESGAELVTETHVRRVLTDNGSVTGIEASAGRSSRRFLAPRVILSAGGIGSAKILEGTGGFGGGNDYFFDPLVAVFGALPEIEGGREFPMAAGIHLEDEGCVLTDLVFPRWMYQFFSAAKFRLDRLHAHRRSAVIMVKIRDDLGGRLTSRGGVRKRLSRADHERLRNGVEHARRILSRAGAEMVYTSRILATHPGGTAKVGEVVDSDLQTRVAGLYVCDCSVIPEAWGLPPTLTILALGKRLAKHLGSGVAA